MNFQFGFKKLVAIQNVSVLFSTCDQSVMLSPSIHYEYYHDFNGTAEII